jgi:hypothetical protein
MGVCRGVVPERRRSSHHTIARFQRNAGPLRRPEVLGTSLGLDAAAFLRVPTIFVVGMG